jgi:hypothetical protein
MKGGKYKILAFLVGLQVTAKGEMGKNKRLRAGRSHSSPGLVAVNGGACARPGPPGRFGATEFGHVIPSVDVGFSVSARKVEHFFFESLVGGGLHPVFPFSLFEVVVFFIIIECVGRPNNLPFFRLIFLVLYCRLGKFL